MMVFDHKSYLRGVPADQRRQMTQRSNAQGLMHLALHAGLIAALGILIALQVPLWGLLLPLQGVLLVFLFTLSHECTHKTPFRSEILNEAVGHVVGVVLLLPFRPFRYFHLAHHRWTNIKGKDPVLEGAEPTGIGGWTWHLSGLGYWTSQLRLIVAFALGRPDYDWLPDTARQAAVRDVRVMCALYTLAALSLFASPVLLWIWLVPMIVAQPLLRVYLLAEHGDCPQVADIFLNTRTTITNRIVRFLAWNMPYHVEHHVWPAVPFHQLPHLHAEIKSHIATTSDGYTAFARDYLDRRR